MKNEILYNNDIDAIKNINDRMIVLRDNLKITNQCYDNDDNEKSHVQFARDCVNAYFKRIVDNDHAIDDHVLLSFYNAIQLIVKNL